MPNVAVVGGGPAGLIAAETLASAGATATVYEHRRSVGRKFLLAGRSGLNLTHAEPLDELLARYGSQRARLEPAIRAFDPDDLRAWAQGLGEPTFVGTSQRVFPTSMRATPLLRSWLRRLDGLGVQFATDHRWCGWNEDGDLHFASRGQKSAVGVDATIFAMGGASWPRVGSNGGWVPLFEDAGISVAPLAAANCGVHVAWSSPLRDRFGGKPIKNAAFRVGETSIRGDAVITDAGMEGGPIYALGPELRSRHDATVVLDLHPDLSEARLVERLSNRRPKASTTSWLDSAGVARISVALVREVTRNQVPTAPAALANLLKALPIPIASLAPIERAISTAGGVDLGQLDDSFMLIDRPGTFLAGEMLDWDAPTGGYLLQACFSTGVAAANGALTWCAVQAAN